MASSNPAEFLALRDVGRIAPGQRANFALLDADLQVRETWIDGRRDGD
jgi:N-acetylglucosamine-6-phosphate deacetylase